MAPNYPNYSNYVPPVTFLMRYVNGKHYVAPVGTSLQSPTDDTWCEYTFAQDTPASQLVGERDRLLKTVEEQKRVILLLTRQNEELIKSIDQHKQVRIEKDQRITQLLGETGAIGGRSPLEGKVDRLETQLQAAQNGIAERDGRIGQLREKAKRRGAYIDDLRNEGHALRGQLRGRANPPPGLESARMQLIEDVIRSVRRVLNEGPVVDRAALDLGVFGADTQLNPIPFVEALIARYEQRGEQIGKDGRELLRLRNTLDAIRSVLK